MTKNILEIKNLYVEYETDKAVSGKKQIIHAVNDVSMEIKEGEIFAIAGESGCGKSTLAKSVIRLVKAKSGQILYNGIDVLAMNKKELKNYRKSAQMIFQNPYSSLNPKMKIFETLKEPLKINTTLSECEILDVIKEKINKTGLSLEILQQYPHEFSGGQRQRIAIARALMLDPKLILADEPLSALDVSIQAQILNLLKELKRDYGLTFLLITHDMSVIKYLADKVAIMYLGEIVESGTSTQLFINPKHPYTKALLNSVPQLDGKRNSEMILKGELPSPTNLPTGCKFHTRCPYYMDICKTCTPNDIEVYENHRVKCFLYMNLKKN